MVKLSEVLERQTEYTKNETPNDELIMYIRRKSRGSLQFKELRNLYSCEQYVFELKSVDSIKQYTMSNFQMALNAIMDSESCSVEQQGKYLTYTFIKKDKGILLLGDGMADFEKIEKKPNELLAYIGAMITGKSAVIDLSMPENAHLLIAGGTGSGKTMVLETFILSLCSRYSSDELNIYISDNKNYLNISEFSELPHVKKTAGNKLEDTKELLEEVERIFNLRKELFQSVKARDIEHYTEITGSHPPYIVLIIEEADVTLHNNKYFNTIVVELAKQGRSLGLHIVVVSQRPKDSNIKLDVLSELSARIILQLNYKVDSDRVLDRSQDAVKLKGRGDMYIKMDGNIPVRAQGAYIGTYDVPVAVETICNADTKRIKK